MICETKSAGQLSEETPDDSWTLLDEFRHVCGEGDFDLAKLIAQHVLSRTLPQDFQDEFQEDPITHENTVYPYTQKDLTENALDHEGSTPLHYACANGHLQIAQYLVDDLKSSCRPNNFGNTPLHWSAMNGQAEITQWLCDTFPDLDVLALNQSGRSALSLAFEAQNENVVIAILNHSSAANLEQGGTDEEELGTAEETQGNAEETRDQEEGETKEEEKTT